MPGSDLEYFTEAEISKGNSVLQFDFELVNEKLKKNLKICAESKGFTIKKINGYRGHQPDGSCSISERLEKINGIQEVQLRLMYCDPLKTALYVASSLFAPMGTSMLFLPMLGSPLTEYWHSIYFDAETGEMLSVDINETAAKLNDMGLIHMQNGLFERALKYFENAYHHSSIAQCYNEYKSNQGKAKNEMFAQNLFKEGQVLFDQGRFSEAEVTFQIAHNLSQVHDVRENCVRKGKEATEYREIDEATTCANQAWDRAWRTEQNEQGEETLTQFREAHSLIAKAFKLQPNNKKIEDLLLVSNFKIEGYLKLKEGVELQNEEGKLTAKQMCEQAREKYLEARDLFQKGFDSSQDSRFTSCIQDLDINLEKINEHIREIAMEETMGKFFDTDLIKEETFPTTAEGMANTQLFEIIEARR